jgi:hypothetical protein
MTRVSHQGQTIRKESTKKFYNHEKASKHEGISESRLLRRLRKIRMPLGTRLVRVTMCHAGLYAGGDRNYSLPSKYFPARFRQAVD